jgi:hypothetical protein
MFKILALVGAIAGGATYGLYAHTDLFKQCDGSGCPLSASSQPQPCCQESSVAKPSCCEETSPCCEEKAACCASKTLIAAGVAPCCASQTIPVSVAKSGCCAASCDEGAKAAIGGSAAFVAGALGK